MRQVVGVLMSSAGGKLERSRGSDMSMSRSFSPTASESKPSSALGDGHRHGNETDYKR